jgi:hypothetical protein
MTFEEFFKKKKIDLTLLQNGEPALFAEFKNHYEQMGEKSFDHTKKYWFNQLRRRFPLPPEVKAEKVHIENRLAEQTVADTLTDPATPTVGFKPRFKAGVVNKLDAEQPLPKEEKSAETLTPTPNMGFKPKFKANMAPKPAEEKNEATDQEKPAAPDAPKPPMGFKPKFRAAAPPPVTDEPVKPDEPAEQKTDEPTQEPSIEPATKPAGFKPRFNMNKMKPKE